MARISTLATYSRLNGKYLREAEKLLEKKDYPHASEKFWGAATEMIKTVAAKRGLSLGTHKSLGEFILKLHKGHPEWDLVTGFQVAQNLHINFYEDHLPEEIVIMSADSVRNFMEKLKNCFE